MNKPYQLSIDGELTIFTAASLATELQTAFDEGPEIEVDLARVTEVDSAGLQLMISAKRQSIATGKPLRFVGHSAVVADLIRFTDLVNFFGDPLVASTGAPT